MTIPLTLLAALACSPAFAADAPAATQPSAAAKPAVAKSAAAKPATGKGDDAAMYTYGYQVGRRIGELGFSAAEVKEITNGLRDAALRKPAAVDVDQNMPRLNEILKERFAKKSEADAKKSDAEAGPQKEKGKAYTEAFAKEAGVKAIPNGAGWYKVTHDGKGAHPSPADTVKVHYRGTLIDGTEFDSSYKRGEPATFALGQVIPCWTNGVGQLQPGAKAKLVCPSDSAYGNSGHPPEIPGGATLVFEVELLEILNSPAK